MRVSSLTRAMAGILDVFLCMPYNKHLLFIMQQPISAVLIND
jgi:hypothetical protein